MQKIIKKIVQLSISLVVLTSYVFANDEQNVFTEQKFTQYIDDLKEQSLAQGISKETVKLAFDEIKFQPKAVVADKNQPEKKIDIKDYLKRAVPNWKVAQAKKLYAEHQDDLQHIGKQYGVQPRFIVALWGAESNFGKFTGNYPVVDALATLAFEGRREQFFRKELMLALQILDEKHISFENFKGSWAGAMGQSQFMPSSFINFAVDADQDGQKDIWKNKLDVFASIANYLSSHGWDDNYIWGRAISLNNRVDPKLVGRDKQERSIKEWESLGVRQENGDLLTTLRGANAKDFKARLISHDNINNEANYLIYNNYNVLMRWNRSHHFALAVGYLADKIVEN